MPQNSISVIKPYKWEGLWVFDDERVDLVKEPFVAGADTLIDTAIEQLGIENADNGFLMLFSAMPFPDSYLHLAWARKNRWKCLLLGRTQHGRLVVPGVVEKLRRGTEGIVGAAETGWVISLKLAPKSLHPGFSNVRLPKTNLIDVPTSSPFVPVSAPLNGP